MEVTFNDPDNLLDRIYDNIHHGFLGILDERVDEKICVVSIGKIATPNCHAYSFLYPMFHKRFDPTSSFQSLYGFKLSANLRGPNTKILIDKNNFKFPDKNSEIIKKVFHYVFSKSAQEVSSSYLQETNSQEETFRPMNESALNGSGLSKRMKTYCIEAFQEIERLNNITKQQQAVLMSQQAEIERLEDELEKGQERMSSYKEKERKQKISGTKLKNNDIASTSDGSFINVKQKSLAKAAVETELKRCCNTERKKVDMIETLGKLYGVIIQSDITKERIGQSVVEFFKYFKSIISTFSLKTKFGVELKSLLPLYNWLLMILIPTNASRAEIVKALEFPAGRVDIQRALKRAFAKRIEFNKRLQERDGNIQKEVLLLAFLNLDNWRKNPRKDKISEEVKKCIEDSWFAKSQTSPNMRDIIRIRDEKSNEIVIK